MTRMLVRGVGLVSDMGLFILANSASDSTACVHIHNAQMYGASCCKCICFFLPAPLDVFMSCGTAGYSTFMYMYSLMVYS